MVTSSSRPVARVYALVLLLAGTAACTPGARSIQYAKDGTAAATALQSETTTSSGGTNAPAAPVATTSQQIFQEEVAQLNQQLNEQQPAYALSDSDVALLQTQGLLDSQEQAQVAPLIKK